MTEPHDERVQQALANIDQIVSHYAALMESAR
jgi:hypothetical protein